MNSCSRPWLWIEHIHTPAARRLHWRFIHGYPEAETGCRDTKIIAGSQILFHLPFVNAKAEQHGNRFVDRQIPYPGIMDAPGGESRY
jgi:hypothetical protein